MNTASIVVLLLLCKFELCHVPVKARTCSLPAKFPGPKWQPLHVSPEGRDAVPRKGTETSRQSLADLGEIVSTGVDTVFSVFKVVEIGYDGFFGLVKMGQDLLKLLKVDEREILITIDVACKSTCRMWIRCYSYLNSYTWYDWVEVEEDDGGYSMRFNTRLHHWGRWLGSWQCDFKNEGTGKMIKGLYTFGGKAPKRHVNMYKLKVHRVQRMDPVLKQEVDGLQEPVYF